MSLGSIGVAYIALGPSRFRDEALVSLSSLRKFHPDLPALIFSDAEDTRLVEAFDRVVHIPQNFGPRSVGAQTWDQPAWLTRIDAVASIPYDRTLFIDTDTEIVGDLSPLWQLLDRFDLAAAHAPYRYQGEIAGIPSSYPEFNCGVIALKSTPASHAFIAAWRSAYLAEKDFWHHDQHAFRKAAWESAARIATLPPEYNLRPSKYTGKNNPVILHGFARGESDPQSASQSKIRLLSNDHGITHHRSGWEFALTCLRPLTHPNGVLVDGMLENTFAWHLSRYKDYLPLREPWIGIAHNPPNIPTGYFDHAHPQRMFERRQFQESLPACLGFFALSEYHAQWLRAQFGKPVNVLYHPVEFGVPQFSFPAFKASPRRPIIHIGWWLRRFESFNQLQAPDYAKCILKLDDKNARACLNQVSWRDDVSFVDRLSDDEFDSLMTRSLVFVDLIDCSANNVVIDCIARATPLLINRHPALEEYLGADYPLFYESLEEAAAHLLDDDLILAASLHMESAHLRSKLSGASFAQQMRNTPLYLSLPSC